MPRLLALVLLCSALTGCELIADFDRDKIPDEHGALPDAGPIDFDAATDETPAQDEDAGDEDGG